MKTEAMVRRYQGQLLQLEKLERESSRYSGKVLDQIMGELRRRTGRRNIKRCPTNRSLHWIRKVGKSGDRLMVSFKLWSPTGIIISSDDTRGDNFTIYERTLKTPEGAINIFCRQVDQLSKTIR